MKKFLMAFAMVAIAGTLPTLGLAQVANGTNGTNVTHVKAGVYTAVQMPSAYNQTKLWKLSKAGVADISLAETGRDAWSVYLNNAQGIYTIDLFKKVFTLPPVFTMSKTPSLGVRVPVATAQTAPVTAADAIVDGANVGGADFAGGGIRFAGAGQWFDALGHSFSERGRDAWSVYLSDNSTNAAAQIDLWKKTVTLPRAAARVITAATVGATNLVGKGSPVVYGATLTSDTLSKTMKWMVAERLISTTPFCYRSSYDRGIGIAPNNCGPGKDARGAFCYDTCRAGFSDNGTPTCLQTSCPSGYTDTGLLCHFTGSSSYSPVHWDSCLHHTFLGCVGGTVEDGCRDGYHKTASMCYKDVPAGMSGSALDPMKGSYTRGTDGTPGCNSDRDMQSGMCYLKPRVNYSCTVTMCSQTCASGTVQCGQAACASDVASCGRGVTNMIVGPLQVITFVATGGAAGPVMVAAKAVVEVGVHANDAVAYAAILQNSIENAMAAAENDLASISSNYIAAQVAAKYGKGSPNYKRIAREWVEVVLAINAAQSGVDMTLLGASIVDETGVVSTITAYANPPCSQDSQIP